VPVWVWIMFAFVLGAIALGFWWSDGWLTPSDRKRLAEESKNGGGWVA
jgi:hypothetical protein